MRLLLVEDDEQLGLALQAGLEQQGYAVDWVRDGMAAELAAMDGAHDLMLLDVALPRQDGLTVLQNLRRAGFSAVVLIITVRDEIQQRAHGLDVGADDFIVKPFAMEELTARISAALSRSRGRVQAIVMHGRVSLDPASRQVTRDGQVVSLTVREFALLRHLVENRGRIRSRDQLQDSLYSLGSSIESNAIEVHVHNLRRKLGTELIRTVHGQGYVIDLPRLGDTPRE